MRDTPRRQVGRLHLLSTREVQTAIDGDHSDGGGLLLRVRGQAASWVYRFTSPISGKRREQGFGAAHRGSTKQAGETLTIARELANKARELVMRGLDPIEERDRQQGAERDAHATRKAAKAREHMTLARAARDYHERVIEPNRTSKHAAQWISSLENHMPASVWHKPIDQIEPPELLAALSEIKPHERARNVRGDSVPETRQRIRQRLDAIFEDAIFYKRCTMNPAAAIKRKMRETMPRGKGGAFRALPFREAPAFMHALRQQPGTAARCLELLVYSVARTSEALEVTADEFDLDEARWNVPAQRMKAGEEHTVYLPAEAVALLRAQLGLKLHPSIVFPSPSAEGAPLSNMALLAVLNRMGYRGKTTVHGLRSTFSTWANETGAARPDVIEACLAHEESNKVRAAYNRAEFAEERRALLKAWATYLNKAPGQVLSIGSRAA